MCLHRTQLPAFHIIQHRLGFCSIEYNKSQGLVRWLTMLKGLANRPDTRVQPQWPNARKEESDSESGLWPPQAHVHTRELTHTCTHRKCNFKNFIRNISNQTEGCFPHIEKCHWQAELLLLFWPTIIRTSWSQDGSLQHWTLCHKYHVGRKKRG